MNVFVTEIQRLEILVDAAGNIVGAKTNILIPITVKIVDEKTGSTLPFTLTVE